MPNEPPSPWRKRRAVALRDDRRRLIWSIGVALWLIAMVAAIVAMMKDDGGVSTDGENVATPLVLSVGILATTPQAFSGTVTSVEVDAITIAPLIAGTREARRRPFDWRRLAMPRRFSADSPTTSARATFSRLPTEP